MQIFLLAAALVTQAPNAADCVYDAVPIATRSSIADAVLAKRAKDVGDEKAFVAATDACARDHR